MRSPRKPGYVPFVPPTPAWVGNSSDGKTTVIAPSGGLSGFTISDLHIADLADAALTLWDCHDVIIQRCTFANVGRGIYLQSCTNITVRDCASYNIKGGVASEWEGNGHFIQAAGSENVTVEDCWALNRPYESNPEDLITGYLTHNMTVRNCRLFGGGTAHSNGGILIGDGSDPILGGGANGIIEGNVLVDCNISYIGTNGTIRKNAVLGRGVVPEWAGDFAAHAVSVAVEQGYPDNPFGPVHLEDNELCWYRPNGSRSGLRRDGIVQVTGTLSTNEHALIDEYSRWTPIGYYGWA